MARIFESYTAWWGARNTQTDTSSEKTAIWQTLLGPGLPATVYWLILNAITGLVGCALLLGSSAAASAETLQNDGFTAGMAVGYQGGFTAGEEAAVELTPPNGNSWKVDKVRFLYGTTALTQTITLKIYAASANATPGAVLFMDDFSVTGSADAMVEIDLTALSVLVNGAFRVSIEFQNAGNPSVASDDDGSLDGTKNFFKIEDGLGGVATNGFLGSYRAKW